MPGIGVVLNPHSKRYKKNPEKLKRMGFIVGDKGHVGATKDLNDIVRVVEEFKERDIDILALSGGDGTNHCTLTTFINVYETSRFPRSPSWAGNSIPSLLLRDLRFMEDFGEPFHHKYHERAVRDDRVTITKIINITASSGALASSSFWTRITGRFAVAGPPDGRSRNRSGPRCQRTVRLQDVRADGRAGDGERQSGLPQLFGDLPGSIEYTRARLRVFIWRDPKIPRSAIARPGTSSASFRSADVLRLSDLIEETRRIMVAS
jgi:hypothetical protein